MRCNLRQGIEGQKECIKIRIIYSLRDASDALVSWSLARAAVNCASRLLRRRW